jgi:hypothetical protein
VQFAALVLLPVFFQLVIGVRATTSGGARTSSVAPSPDF